MFIFTLAAQTKAEVDNWAQEVENFKIKIIKMRTKIFLFIVSLIVFCSWTDRKKDEIRRAEWLIGTWENKTQKGSIYETWTKISDNQLAGKSYALNNNDTVVFENIHLVQEQNSLFYIPQVRNQNNNLPIRFALKTITDTSLTFENLKHDFPQVISYTKINNDSLVAEISGTKNRKERKQKFLMRRCAYLKEDMIK